MPEFSLLFPRYIVLTTPLFSKFYQKETTTFVGNERDKTIKITSCLPSHVQPNGSYSLAEAHDKGKKEGEKIPFYIFLLFFVRCVFSSLKYLNY